MPVPENIVQFHAQALKIFGALYLAHPRAVYIDPEFVYGRDTDDRDEIEFAQGTIRYLVENGYVNAESVGDYDELRLNARSWAALDKPNPLEPTQSIGQSASRWAKDAASSAGKDGVSALGGIALKTVAMALGLPG